MYSMLQSIVRKHINNIILAKTLYDIISTDNFSTYSIVLIHSNALSTTAGIYISQDTSDKLWVYTYTACSKYVSTSTNNGTSLLGFPKLDCPNTFEIKLVSDESKDALNSNVSPS